ncbi:hypothetical protein GF373_00505, partial [bacterium]|nr:hypothetical protein [bacterium]
VYTNHVNLNTVKAEVLEALMFDTIGEDAESIAREWVEYREKDNPLKTLDNSDMDDSHFTDVTGFTPAVMKGIRQFVSVSSNIFVVTSLAEYKGIQKGFKAVCARRYLTFEELPQFGMDTFNVEDLQQVPVWIRKIEPLYDVKERLERAI